MLNLDMVIAPTSHGETEGYIVAEGIGAYTGLVWVYDELENETHVGSEHLCEHVEPAGHWA